MSWYYPGNKEKRLLLNEKVRITFDCSIHSYQGLNALAVFIFIIVI